jgi:hypothetical protein
MKMPLSKVRPGDAIVGPDKVRLEGTHQLRAPSPRSATSSTLLSAPLPIETEHLRERPKVFSLQLWEDVRPGERDGSGRVVDDVGVLSSCARLASSTQV